MNILTERMPETLTINSCVFPINYDFRTGIKFELMADEGIDDVFTLIKPFFPSLNGIWGGPATAIFEAVLWFFRCGAEPVKSDEPAKEKGYSFETDADVIFSDFWRYYSIDLSSANLHWWAFRALLMGLPSESEFKQRIYYRTCDLKGLPKEERARINKIRELIGLDKHGTKMTLEERNTRMLEYVAKRTAECKRG